MGLERVSAVLQGVESNYQTDLFTPLIAKAAELTGFKGIAKEPGAPRFASETWENHPESTGTAANAERQGRDTIPAQGNALGTVSPTDQRAESPTHHPATGLSLIDAALSDEKGYASLRIIADHARAATFLINDGVQPQNEGRGYVLRKILRRAIRHGRNLGQNQPFMHQMVLAVRDEMQTAYPELNDSIDRIAKVVLAEEEQFARVIAIGSVKMEDLMLSVMKSWLEKLIDLRGAYAVRSYYELEGEQRRLIDRKPYEALSLESPEDVATLLRSYRHYANPSLDIPPSLEGRSAFHLYETYGLPKDYIADAARDAGLVFDDEGFDLAKEEEQQRARASWKGGSQKTANPVFQTLAKTEFEGYSALRVDGARVLALVKDGVGVQVLNPGEQGEVVLDATSFYADSGGQIGDTGVLYASDHHTVVAEVRGATKPVQGVFAHKVTAKQTITIGDEVDTAVNGEVRTATERNHTGTHLLHAALREVLGKHVKQAGSLVNQNRLRFDFSHFTGVSEQELEEIETIVNQQVLANAHVETLVDVPIDVAVKELGAMALFGEKYGDRVRVVKIGDFSTELCGGTHTRATGEIGLIKLVGESAVSSGVRRLEAISGTSSLNAFRRDYEITRAATQALGLGNNPDADSLRARLATADEELKKLRRELDQARMKAANANTAEAEPVEVNGVKVLAQRVSGLDKNQMRTLVDSLRTKLGSGVVVLGAEVEGKVALIVGVTKDLTGKIPAGKVVGQLAALVDGRGGGRPDLAEAGGANVAALDSAIAKATEVVATFLA